MENAPYQELLEKAKVDYGALQAKLGACIKEQAQLEKRIADVKQTIVALSKMLGEEFVEEDALGLTDAIRMAFKTHPDQALTPTGLKERLEQLGFDTGKYGNVMASVHSIINRLATRGEIKQTGTIGGADKPAYIWAGMTPATEQLIREAIGRTPTTRERFKQAHEAKLAREKADATSRRLDIGGLRHKK
jgi:hypothetical protein